MSGMETTMDSGDIPVQMESENDVGKIPILFTGKASEYFRIWIVNVALTILTLGIYSAWAKVRTRKYLYGNTLLEGSSFRYDANPLAILIGRIIAVLLFGSYSAMFYFAPRMSIEVLNLLPIAVLIIIFGIGPWIIVKSLRFNMKYTSYRNIRFGFDGTYFQVMVNWFLIYLLAIPTLGLIIPYIHFLQKKFLIEKTRYGKTNFVTRSKAGYFYLCYLMAGILSIFVGIAMSLAIGITQTAFSGSPLLLWIHQIFSTAGFLIVYMFIRVSIFNHIVGKAEIGEKKIFSSLKTFEIFKIYFTNIFLIVFSLGLLVPWAKIRLFRYKAEHIHLSREGDMETFISAQESGESALGEEVGEIFDFDVSI